MRQQKQIYELFLMILLLASCRGQKPTDQPEVKKDQIGDEVNPLPPMAKTDTLFYKNAPQNITRNIIQDKKGHIWFATFGGVFKYDGNAFTNVLKEQSKGRFFSVLEDRKGNMWFGSIGDGLYHYDGKSFQNFTTEDGLLNNEIVWIFEDKKGDIWFGVNGGASRYDGNTFHNYTMNGYTMMQDTLGKTIPNVRPSNEVGAIIEDKTGKFWLGTRGRTYMYDGKSFETVKQNGNSFTNVRCIIEDKKGNIWLGGNDGLWRYDGTTFSKITDDFVGYLYEDKKGNIWTSSQTTKGWTLSRYDKMAMDNAQYTASIIKTGERMLFGILEDLDGHIWVGTLNGVYRYDGNKFDYFKR